MRAKTSWFLPTAPPRSPGTSQARRPKQGRAAAPGGKPPHDSTASVPEGTFVQTTGLITSLLYDPSGDGNISETARRGAIAQVAACAETVRNGKTTWAYQLTSGDWVLAYNVQEVEGGTASFTGAQAVCSGRDELLQFSGSGTPAGLYKPN